MPLPKDSMFFGFADKLTDEQRIYVNSIFDRQLTLVNARSGTGKTTLAVAAAKLLGKPLVYVFSPVEEGRMGFRPGNQREKESAYVTPLHDALYEIGEDPAKAIFDPENAEALKRGTAWVYPMSHIFARGTNIKGKTVIIGESQNFTRGELKKLLTRIHDDCTVILEGHTEQCDLQNVSKSGFAPYIEHFRSEPYAQVCELTVNFRGQLAQHADTLEW
ncbi:PhoH family protein [Paenibacillus sp. FSL R7-269]|uniref:PhoH family protein n=1 Tax=Paenibacillus sp. FSL R7-269 TaxID=1226755 RepID=UPI0003E210AA|nr:PhoH family protein [Paenibacillus sp. FSL R7-269]ETT41589.1 PhoH family protein [Paenibacillus sp. FSL R7-269]